MSCFSTELQALQLLFPKSASGIARALPSLYIFKFLDSRCRPLVSLSDNLNPFQRCRLGKHVSCVGMRREWPNLCGLAPRHTQRAPTYRDPSTEEDGGLILKWGLVLVWPCRHGDEVIGKGDVDLTSMYFMKHAEIAYPARLDCSQGQFKQVKH